MSDNRESFAREVAEVSLEERMESAYLDYAMSVIVGRALPDVRDGLKPVHRRILHSMREAGNDWNKPYKKSARIVGDVLGKYHPHGGEAVYDALVRLAQTFSMRAPLVDGQGNFGSIDGDNPAAMRYTEVRMAKIAHAILVDIDKDTVDFIPNYDGAEKEPTVLPARFPNLLINGSAGIAVGMATNIPPHNPVEVIDAALMLLKNPEAGADDLIKVMPAPDFPTGGLLSGMGSVRDAYRTGRGRVIMRARTHFESLDKKSKQGKIFDSPPGGRQAIIIDELPYQVNKASLIARIADLARDKKIEGISDLRDESDRRGIRVVIELKRGENAEVILNRLFKETQMQDSFSINMVALANGVPSTMSLPEILRHFIVHRREVVTRRAKFELKKARVRAHLLEGYAAAISSVDEVVDLIKKAPSPAEAEKRLMARPWPAKTVSDMLARLENPRDAMPEDADPARGLQKGGYLLSTAQAKAILDLRLARLTAMERDKIAADYAAAVDEIIGHMALLSSESKLVARIASELKEIRGAFDPTRRSEISEFDTGALDMENLIAEEDMMVTFSHRGYVKRQAVSDYSAQRRGGRGKKAAGTREDDFISRLFVASTHDYLMLFTNFGRAYCKKVYQLPQASRIGRGKPIVGVLNLQEDETVQTVLPFKGFDDDACVIFATASGMVKKTALKKFANIRSNGIIAIKLREGDRLISASLIGDKDTVLLFSNSAKVIRFASSTVRASGRGTTGVRGMRFKSEDERVVSMLALPDAESKIPVLIAADNGRGKRTNAAQFPVKGRGGKGVIALQLKSRNKDATVVGATLADDKDELMLITDGGVLVRTRMSEIRQIGRNAQGFSLISLDSKSRLVGIASVEESESDDGEEEEAGSESESTESPNQSD